MLKKTPLYLLKILALIVLSNINLEGQCKGFEIKQDQFKGETKMNTLFIYNSTKLRSPKAQYRLDYREDSLRFVFSFLINDLVTVDKGDELIFISTSGEKINLKSEDYVVGEPTNYGGINLYQNEVWFKITLDDLKKWNQSFTDCRMYFNRTHMTFPFDHKRNYKLFHNAKDCFIAELEK